ncbi:hypothetical protein [Pelotomaculum schinkii]|nr:hypothetical protein [Pelotomaculum schinkii]
MRPPRGLAYRHGSGCGGHERGSFNVTVYGEDGTGSYGLMQVLPEK